MIAGPLRLPLALGIAAVAAAAVVVALVTVGGPGTARLERYDERRVRDMTELVNAIERHRIFAGRLPGSLGEVRAGLSGRPSITDPETGAPYGYEVLGDGRFRVCTRLSVPGAPPAMPGPIRLGDSRRVVNPVPGPEGRLCWETAAPPG